MVRGKVIHATCSACGREYKFPDQFSGKTVKCKECSAPVVVPSGSPGTMPLGAEDEPRTPARVSPAVGEIECPFCGGPLKEGVKKCRHCGEWLVKPPETAPPPPPPPPVHYQAPPPYAMQQSNNQVQNVVVNVGGQRDESIAFAIITLICWFLLPPLALILNIIGLFTGPRRGCFFWMLFVIMLPTLILVALILSGTVALGTMNFR